MSRAAELRISVAKPDSLPHVLLWLREEDARTGEGFYCKHEDIRDAFLDGTAMVGQFGGFPVAFALFYFAPPGSGVSMLEVHPDERRRGHGKTMLQAVLAHLLANGAEYAIANAVSSEGAALCLSTGFQEVRLRPGSSSSTSSLRFRLQLLSQGATKA